MIECDINLLLLFSGRLSKIFHQRPGASFAISECEALKRFGNSSVLHKSLQEDVMRHTKILATLGPSTDTAIYIEALLTAGADAIRLNFSHGNHEWHRSVYQRVRLAAQKLGQAVPVVQDLQGPKIRLGEILGHEVELVTGSSLTITTHPIQGTAERLPTSYRALPLEVSNGDRILIDEGRIRLTVNTIQGTEIHCVVDMGGTVSSRKGIHIPGVKLNIPSLTEKDQTDAEFGLELGVDFMALSFVRSAEDVEHLRAWMKQKGKVVPIISKIETAQALDHLEEIIDASDAVMVARGDLGVETSLDLIPFYQKKIIQLANQRGKLVITATQMLESMISHHSPTRAEITDVANSILDGTDVMMLSGETAVGRFPIATVQQMARIADTTERTLYPFDNPEFCSKTHESKDLTPTLVRLIGQASREFQPKAIAVFTRTGATASLVSTERPRTPIFAFTPDESTYRRLALLWGVVPMKISERQASSRIAKDLTNILVQSGTVTSQDLILILLGSNSSPGDSNSIRIGRAEAMLQEN